MDFLEFDADLDVDVNLNLNTVENLSEKMKQLSCDLKKIVRNRSNSVGKSEGVERGEMGSNGREREDYEGKNLDEAVIDVEIGVHKRKGSGRSGSASKSGRRDGKEKCEEGFSRALCFTEEVKDFQEEDVAAQKAFVDLELEEIIQSQVESFIQESFERKGKEIEQLALKYDDEILKCKGIQFPLSCLFFRE